MINIEETKLQCENGCIHAQVCGHKEQWANYCKEHIKLREKSILFDEEPKCRYYIHESRLKEEEQTIKVNKDDLIEKIKKSNVIKNKDNEGRNPYRDDYGWHFDNDKRKVYEELAKPYKNDEINHIRDDENVKVRKLTDEELIKVVERFLGL